MAEVADKKAAPRADAADKPVDIAGVIGLDTIPLAELQKKVPDLAIARAWAAGDIEFGRRQHCITGPVGRDNSALVFEAGIEWPHPKLDYQKKSYREFQAETMPKVGRFKKYVREVLVNREKDTWVPIEDISEANGREVRWTPVVIDEDEAAEMYAIQVRLTEKGLAGSK